MKRYTPDFPEMMRLCETNFAQLRRLLPRTDAAGEKVLWSSFFGHADQMVGLCTGGQLGGRAGQRFVLCG